MTMDRISLHDTKGKGEADIVEEELLAEHLKEYCPTSYTHLCKLLKPLEDELALTKEELFNAFVSAKFGNDLKKVRETLELRKTLDYHIEAVKTVLERAEHETKVNTEGMMEKTAFAARDLRYTTR